MYLIFDTETTGLPRDYNAPISDADNWPRLVQLAWQMHDAKGKLVEVKNYIVKPEGFTIPFNAEKIHGISTDRALQQGVELKFVLDEFQKAVDQATFLVGHNIEFDINIMGAEYLRKDLPAALVEKQSIDTKDESTDYCAIPGGRGGKFKWPTLTELHHKLFNEGFDAAHNASADVEATARCFLELIRVDVIGAERMGVSPAFITEFKTSNPDTIQLIGLNIEPYSSLDSDDNSEETATAATTDIIDEAEGVESAAEIQTAFSHLHVHSQFSVLQSTIRIKELVGKAKEMGMPAVAMTDSGNMFGVFNFVREAKYAGIKPIVGCELNIAEDHTNKKLKDNGYMQVFLAKNKEGYQNLTKLSSIAFTEGFYYVPRINRELVKKYSDNLIATTGGIKGEIPDLILNVGEQQAEDAFKWWLNVFGEDFYVQLMRHGLEEEDRASEVLLQFARKYDVKVIAANNAFYLEKEDANAHDILLCVQKGELQSTPIGKGRGYRFGFPNDEFYFKSQEEMKELFTDLPEAIDNIQEVVDKVEAFELERDVIMPSYDLPEGFTDQNDYLRHITYEGAKKRYEEITPEVEERLDFELKVVKEMGFPGYFLIVQDFTTEARNRGVWVGPGRGSAAGSAVAYAIGITNIDPIKYKLLFERFLNPERVSMPDIDIDFDDEGRNQVIQYVIDKYGISQVAQIITYGSMAAKSAIRDVARVMDLPLPESDRIAKLVPDFAKLNRILTLDMKELKKQLNSDDVAKVEELRNIAEGNDEAAKVLQQALKLEGSIRNTGIHACGVIITPDDMTDFIPVCTAKDSDLMVTQFDNKVVEDAGMLKMDFLGLKTLTIIKDAIAIVKDRHGNEIDPDLIPLDDEKTFQLYQRGETNGTFQFESGGMQKSLKELQPSHIEDLIAMNALYRPGPMQFIDTFVKRKSGKEEVEYPHEKLEPVLKDTYGIMVYQEQIMQTAQVLAGYSLGQADLLRRAMGKKKMDVMMQQKEIFKQGAKEYNDIPEKQAEDIFNIMVKFAEYGFNRSHSAAYSVLAFQTGYLKANYPAEYMAAVLTNNMNDIKKVTFFMEESRRMGIPVLGPDVNESIYKFTVNANGEVRFGLGAIKGVGKGAIDALVEERLENGHYTSIFDVTSRVDLRAANKKTFESLALSGAFDSFAGVHRAQYFVEDNGRTFLEQAIKFGANYQESKNSAQTSLFGEGSAVEIPEPSIPDAEPWGTLDELSKEKEVVGIYISGHPLDDFKLELDTYCNTTLSSLKDLEKIEGREAKIGGIVSSVSHRISKTGKPFGSFVLEDYSESHEFMLFSDDYVSFKKYMEKGWFLYVVGKSQKRRWGDSNECEFKISKIELLTEISNKLSNGLHLTVNIDQVDDQLIADLELICADHQGNEPLKLTILDHEEKLNVDMYSNKFRLAVNKELLTYLESHHKIQYKLN